MPVKPTSRFASLPQLRVISPAGQVHDVVALPLGRRAPVGTTARYRVAEAEPLDLLARKFYGDERLFWRLLDANPVVYPLDVGAGDVLDVPAPGPVTRATRTRTF